MWTLRDTKVPFVLRAVPRTDYLQLIGNACLRDFMRGKVIESGKAEFSCAAVAFGQSVYCDYLFIDCLAW